ncbi:capsid protein [Cricetid gammaherpesvirus 2]|uniref:Capsid protein n=1 Tax=Cricetid gammaherpesvirus 2 TaxID=1605972 RepID=E9M5K9_9GAMA|nr:capsid protein [Cricetid gammaherpesvirus 2]ADW24367.1 capsid protein [Cricetid gammaherpesvirus 2]ADW24449.1 capsid protein [Cricetid gammaherpesvirus 2]
MSVLRKETQLLYRMALDKTIIVPLTSRLYADEISALQSKIGALVPVHHYHRLQNVQALGLHPVIYPEADIDWIAAFRFLSRCTLAILESVAPDAITLTRLDYNENYQLKNVNVPETEWPLQGELAVIPPIFGVPEATISLASNDMLLVLPSVVPAGLAQMAIQKILLYNIYSRIVAEDNMAADMELVRHATGSVAYMGRNYILQLQRNAPAGALAVLDDVSICTSVLCAVIPGACANLAAATIRQGRHELVEVFEGLLPDGLEEIQRDNLNVAEDISKMGLFMSYVCNLSSIFNLGQRLRVSGYEASTKTCTCWLG